MSPYKDIQKISLTCVFHKQDIGFFFFFSFLDSLIFVTWEEVEGKGSDVPLINTAEDKSKSIVAAALMTLSTFTTIKQWQSATRSVLYFYFT